jgi:hypothetical protein
MALAAPPASPPTRQPPLPPNPNAAPFSPSSTPRLAEGEDLPDYLLFNPSSSKGLSSGPRGGWSASPVSSFTDVVKHKGKAPMVAFGSGSSPGRSQVMSGSIGCPALPCPPPPLEAAWGGFMADACCTPRPPCPGPPPVQSDARCDGWQVIQRRKKWSRLRQPPPPPLLAARSPQIWWGGGSTACSRTMSRRLAPSLSSGRAPST